ncbi:hypothetical protein [Peribacillus muralis]|uniref:hypothetical protein n=1 Tax=Peribacillus muralis TaxID=264697 RepID=UPI00070AB250|nr:hypothetical protein [Peribacillus muralis]
MLRLLCLSGCSQTKVQQPPNNATPGFVTEKDVEEVDWIKNAAEFNTDAGSDMVGNEHKVGIIGPELKPNKIEKWLWHFWGIDKGKLTLVGYHKESKGISPVFSEAVWSRKGIGGGQLNGADASLPTNVVLTKAGKWAILIYIDGQLFDILVIEVNA